MDPLRVVPFDIFNYIIFYVDLSNIEETKNCILVSHNWKRYIVKHCITSSKQVSSSNSQKWFSQFPNLKGLYIKSFNLEWNGFNFDNITTLIIGNVKTNDDFSLLGKCSKLENLHLTFGNLELISWDLSHLTKLTFLGISNKRSLITYPTSLQSLLIQSFSRSDRISLPELPFLESIYTNGKIRISNLTRLTGLYKISRVPYFSSLVSKAEFKEGSLFGCGPSFIEDYPNISGDFPPLLKNIDIASFTKIAKKNHQFEVVNSKEIIFSSSGTISRFTKLKHLGIFSTSLMLYGHHASITSIDILQYYNQEQITRHRGFPVLSTFNYEHILDRFTSLTCMNVIAMTGNCDKLFHQVFKNNVHFQVTYNNSIVNIHFYTYEKYHLNSIVISK